MNKTTVIVEISGGNVQAAWAERDGKRADDVDLVVRDFDNIEAGDEDVDQKYIDLCKDKFAIL